MNFRMNKRQLIFLAALSSSRSLVVGWLVCQSVGWSQDFVKKLHLRFKHAQPKMCLSPTVENEVDNIFILFCDQYFWTILL